jgi:hypothetical protein
MGISYVTEILTLLSLAIDYILHDQNFWNLKEAKMLQKNFELSKMKVRNYEILPNWMKLSFNIGHYFEI